MKNSSIFDMRLIDAREWVERLQGLLDDFKRANYQKNALYYHIEDQINDIQCQPTSYRLEDVIQSMEEKSYYHNGKRVILLEDAKVAIDKGIVQWERN